MESKQYEAEIIKIDGQCLHIAKKGGGSWKYAMSHAPKHILPMLELLQERQENGWETLAIGRFDRNEKGLELKELGL